MMGSPTTASSCGEQTAHPNPPRGCQRKKIPRRGGKDGSVAGMPRPPCPHQGSWADCLERVGECQWAKSISLSSNIHSSRLWLLCHLVAPKLPHYFLHEGHQSWDDTGTCLRHPPIAPSESLAADESFCSFLSTPQALRHREHLHLWDPKAGSTPAPQAWLSMG